MSSNTQTFQELTMDNVSAYIDHITNQYDNLNVLPFKNQVIKVLSNYTKVNHKIIYKLILNYATNYTSKEEPLWSFVASNILRDELYKQASKNRSYDYLNKYGSFYNLIVKLTEIGIYNSNILEYYSQKEISDLEKELVPERDNLFNILGLETLSNRYLATDGSGNTYELPQERFMIIAMDLMRLENKNKRLQYIKELYWALSNLYLTVATPTLANSGKSYGQKSSCFILTTDDDLISIYNDNTDIATLSKNGAGIGVYYGKIRSRGAKIRQFQGASKGVIPWMQNLDATAVAANQLGQRKAAIAVYLDIWHMDIEDFLSIKLNNGDAKLRCHNLYHGICIPDIFMEAVNKNESWYTFCPHDVKEIMGFSLEDCYDEEFGSGTFRERYALCVKNPNLRKKQFKARDLYSKIIESQLETGTPYLFFRDTVNRMNPNRHAGMIYCSNLCTEIAQNQSVTSVKTEVLKDDGEVITYKQSGDFVTCNLSSLVLPRIMRDNVLERVVEIQIRALDNVIEVNDIPISAAVHTNKQYRAVGAGEQGWHHLFALEGIKWESEQAINRVEELSEDISYFTIRASMRLSKEKGAYPLFKGSDWESGAYFEKRNYNTNRWSELSNDIKIYGIRNGYLRAVAPTGTTSLIANSTAGVDPILELIQIEEKKDLKIKNAAPDLGPKTIWFYKNGRMINQMYSVIQNIKRQRHVDQAISFNLYVTPDISFEEVFIFHYTAWKNGMKTCYYLRAGSITEEDCSYCSA